MVMASSTRRLVEVNNQMYAFEDPSTTTNAVRREYLCLVGFNSQCSTPDTLLDDLLPFFVDAGILTAKGCSCFEGLCHGLLPRQLWIGPNGLLKLPFFTYKLNVRRHFKFELPGVVKCLDN